MSDILRILLLEDSARDAELIEEAIARAGVSANTVRVDTRDAFARALLDFRPHVVLSDHALAQFNARAALDVLRDVWPLAPLIVVTGSLDGQGAVEALRHGAEDLILKENLHRLPASIAEALAVRRPLEQLSPRQMEVLRLVVDGATTREIAQRLQLSVKTIETHRGEVMKRLGIHDLVSLVRYATRVGLVKQVS
jgi:DNA-binding NarL/FixJ family response regulator